MKRKKLCTRKRESVDRHRRVSHYYRCSKDSSRKGRRPRFEKNRGTRFQMATIILRVAKSQHQNQLQSIIQIQNLILWQTTEAKTFFRAMSKSKARSSSRKNCSSTAKSKVTSTLTAF